MSDELNQLVSHDQNGDVYSKLHASSALDISYNHDHNLTEKHQHHLGEENHTEENPPDTEDFVISTNMLSSFVNSAKGDLVFDAHDPMDNDENQDLMIQEAVAAASAVTSAMSPSNLSTMLSESESQKRLFPDPQLGSNKKQQAFSLLGNDSDDFSADLNSLHDPLSGSRSKTIKFTPNRTSENIKKQHTYVTNPNSKKSKRESIKGPPKNSRFFKVYGLEGAKNIKASSLHHYNPYRYPQNRSKLNPFPDFIKNRKEESVDVSNERGINTSSQKNPAIPDLEHHRSDSKKNKIPELRPTLEEFEDIYSYIESIKDIGEKFGAVKVIPPKEFSPKFAINLESFWIKSNRQLWNSPSDELNSRCEFYNQLKNALKDSGISINKLPCIDKRAIDLYRLYRVVNLRGGFENCCNDKLWAQIGRELGFYGKISSSLSSSIKTVYQKYISPWEKKYQGTRDQDYLNLVRNDEAQCLFPQSGEDDGLAQVPIILGSSNPFPRNRQHLVDSGFSTYFDQSTTQKKGITVSDTNTLPTYDFYRWSDPNQVDDVDPRELKISSLYTLKQFYDKSRIVKNTVLSKFNDTEHFKFENMEYLESSFWSLLKRSDVMFETEVSFNQYTNIHDSSYENKFLSDKSGNLSDSILGSLNFNNTAIYDGSLLQYADSYSNSLFHSCLNFAMFYGCQSWKSEDHWLYNVDYHYLGDAKSYYVIPPEYREKYEDLIRSYIELQNKAYERTAINLQKFEKAIDNSDIFNACLENQISYDMNVSRARPLEPKFEKLVDQDTYPIRYNTDIMLTPEILRKNGIPVYHTFQEVGDMIIKFPKSYSSYFSLGTSVTESVQLANVDWLSCSLEADRWLQKQQILPNFSTFLLILRAARDSDDIKILKAIKPILEKMITDELDKRVELRKNLKETSYNKYLADFKEYTNNNVLDKKHNGEATIGTELIYKLGSINRMTDSDLADIFPSFVLAKSAVPLQSSFTMSVSSFLQRKDQIVFENMGLEFELVTMCSDEYLTQSVDILHGKLEGIDSWIAKYSEIISASSRPDLNKVVPLIEKGNTLFNAKNTRYYTDYQKEKFKSTFDKFMMLKKEVEKTEVWQRKAQILTKIPRENFNTLFPFSEFKTLVDEIKHLNLYVDEIREIQAMSEEIITFDLLAVSALDKANTKVDLAELEKLYAVGSNIKVELETLTLIGKIVRRASWMELLRKDVNTVEELKEIYDAGKSFDSSNPEDIKLLDELKNKIDHIGKILLQYDEIKQTNHQVATKELLELEKECMGFPLKEVQDYIKTLLNDSSNMQNGVIPIVDIIKEKISVQSNETSAVGRINAFLKYYGMIKKGITDLKFDEIYQTLCKFEEYQDAAKIFKEQIIDGPLTSIKELSEKFKRLLNFGRDDTKFQNLGEVDCLNHLVSYDMDILTNQEERYCVCRQKHEGNMVECEECKQWFHFNCVGYVKTDTENDKYFCPLCDIEGKYPSTQNFYLNLLKKTTLEELIQTADKMAVRGSICISFEHSFFNAVLKYVDFYNLLLEQGAIRENNGEIDVCISDEAYLRSLLQKVNGCVINFRKLQSALQNKYASLRLIKDETSAKVGNVAGLSGDIYTC